MNRPETPPGPPDLGVTGADEQHPWLGLGSFTEASRGYFFGREEEVAELARRVQRKLLTILFGKSGLGKTSILQAGVVPRLRNEGYCPIYVRISYVEDAPSPAEQIKREVFRATEASGTWTQVGVAEAGEPLWEFLHHRDDVLRDSDGRVLMPLIIFDQFEEIFTLGQTDDAGRARAAEFLEDLADLVENRPPKALEARLERDDSAGDRFDFARTDYRVLIALREDYLAPLESLKRVMPSVALNRMRLPPMTGAQALVAVRRPGGHLVSDEVAAAIVRLVAGGAELGNAEVEPSLLSLICRELNEARIELGLPEITLAMLDGSHAGILGEFYERSVADQPAAVRRFIEDKLLTESGFRESVAEENVLAAFAEAGAAASTLSVLVNRRLLRIEERLDVRRVELTHDVLCRFVKDSRDKRIERDRRAAMEHQLADQRGRTQRARRVASFCIAISIVALIAAASALFALDRARRAELQTQVTRANAENLVSYVTNELTAELKGFGHEDVVARLAKQEAEYYRGLPAPMQTPDTQRNLALALVRYGEALGDTAKLEDAERVLNESLAILEPAYAAGDHSEATALGLTLAYSKKASVVGLLTTSDAAVAIARKGPAVIAPFLEGTAPSEAVRRAGAEAYAQLAAQELYTNGWKDSLGDFERSRSAARPLIKDPQSDVLAAVMYAMASSGDGIVHIKLNQAKEATALAIDGLQVITPVLQKYPFHLGALQASARLHGVLADAADVGLDLRGRREELLLASQAWETLSTADPTEVPPLTELANSEFELSEVDFRQGHFREELQRITHLQKVLEASPLTVSPFIKIDIGFTHVIRGADFALLGDAAASPGEVQQGQAITQDLADHAAEVIGDFTLCQSFFLAAMAGNLVGDYPRALHDAQSAIAWRKSLNFQSNDVWRDNCYASLDNVAVIAALGMRDAPLAEKSARDEVELRARHGEGRVGSRMNLAEAQTLLAVALAWQGKEREARDTLAPALATLRETAPKAPDNANLQLRLIEALYADALIDSTRRARDLSEIRRRTEQLPPDMKDSLMVRPWVQRADDLARGAPRARN